MGNIIEKRKYCSVSSVICLSRKRLPNSSHKCSNGKRSVDNWGLDYDCFQDRPYKSLPSLRREIWCILLENVVEIALSNKRQIEMSNNFSSNYHQRVLAVCHILPHTISLPPRKRFVSITKGSEKRSHGKLYNILCPSLNRRANRGSTVNRICCQVCNLELLARACSSLAALLRRFNSDPLRIRLECNPCALGLRRIVWQTNM